MIKDDNLRKEYYRQANKKRVDIRFAPEELAVLESKMKSEGWENKGRYIKRKLFGKDFDAKLKDMIRKGNPWDLENLMIHEARAMAEAYDRFSKEFFKSNDKMYRELKIEKITLDKFSYKISRAFWKLHRQTEERFKVMREIAEVLKIDSYFRELGKEYTGNENPNSDEFIEYDAKSQIDDILLGRQSIDDMI